VTVRFTVEKSKLSSTGTHTFAYTAVEDETAGDGSGFVKNVCSVCGVVDTEFEPVAYTDTLIGVTGSATYADITDANLNEIHKGTYFAQFEKTTSTTTMWLTYKVTKAGDYTISFSSIDDSYLMYFYQARYIIETITESDGQQTVSTESLFSTVNRDGTVPIISAYANKAKGETDSSKSRVVSIKITFNEEDIGKVVKFAVSTKANAGETAYSIINVDIPDDGLLRVSKGNKLTADTLDDYSSTYTVEATFTAPESRRYVFTMPEGINAVSVFTPNESGDLSENFIERSDDTFVITLKCTADVTYTFLFYANAADTYNIKVEAGSLRNPEISLNTALPLYETSGVYEIDVADDVPAGTYQIVLTPTYLAVAGRSYGYVAVNGGDATYISAYNDFTAVITVKAGDTITITMTGDGSSNDIGPVSFTLSVPTEESSESDT
jgi:hypothetical protein